ncbi:MAG TPA: DNA polymerase III subunit delta' [Candidatus Binatia bacterium]|nr:DNA polymerase III subunit delta' [Candidatus Binatia bacterium]
MTLPEVRGQERAVAALRRAIAGGRLAHAYVFAGPPGVGKRTTALALARACLCPEAPDEGCGVCTECRLVAAGSHPDLFIEDLARAQLDKPNATHLSIDQIRRVRSHLALRPVRGARKVALVDPAERMTADAQNALLKTLEEPPGSATLILVSSNPDALLPTIRSRCQRLAFRPLSDELVAELLAAEGIEPEAARWAAPLADGSLDVARELASGDAAERCREIRERLDRLGRSSIPDTLDFAAELAPPRGAREHQGLYAAAVVDWCRRRAHAAAEAARSVAGDRGDDALVAVRTASQRLERAYATSRDLERNANAHLAWDCLLLDLRASVRTGA